MALDFPANPTNGQIYENWTWNGEAWRLTSPLGVVQPGLFPTQVVIYTTPGSYNFVKADYPDLYAVKVRMSGGGGGGGGCAATNAGEGSVGGGGAAGSVVETVYLAETMQDSVPFVVGAGGAGGVGNQSGVQGGQSEWNPTTNNLIVYGGYGGRGGASQPATSLMTFGAPVSPGAIGAYDWVIQGGGGHPGAGALDTNSGGFGGGNPLAAGGQGGNAMLSGGGADGVNGRPGGGGGGGGANKPSQGTAKNGGDGGDGAVLFEIWQTVKLSAPPAASLRFSTVSVTANFAVPHQTNTVVVWDELIAGEDWRTGGLPSSNLVAPVNGVYEIISVAEYSTTPGVSGGPWRFRDSIATTSQTWGMDWAPAPTGQAGNTKTVVQTMTAGDVVNLTLWQDTGLSQNATIDTTLTIKLLEETV
jgi:hypothetical protein